MLQHSTQRSTAQHSDAFMLCYATQELAITPVVNKIDLPHAQVEGTLEQMEAAFDIQPDRVRRISAKTGQGAAELLPALIADTPPPTAARGKPLRVFLFDSRFCEYRGVLCLVQVLDGALLPGAQLQSASSGKVAHTGHLPQMGIASS